MPNTGKETYYRNLALAGGLALGGAITAGAGVVKHEPGTAALGVATMTTGVQRLVVLTGREAIAQRDNRQKPGEGRKEYLERLRQKSLNDGKEMLPDRKK